VIRINSLNPHTLQSDTIHSLPNDTLGENTRHYT
jgi:hypothetical protein